MIKLSNDSTLPMGWRWVKCQDAIDVRDGTHDTPRSVSKGIPLITSKNLTLHGIDFNDVLMISREDHLKIQKRSRVDRGDILFAMIGTIGNPVIVDTDRTKGGFTTRAAALAVCLSRAKLSLKHTADSATISPSMGRSRSPPLTQWRR